MSLPIIDISNPDDRTVGKAMLDAAVRYGFFYVSSQSTDFKAEDVQRAFSMSQEFFASPKEEKIPCAISNNRGWSGMHVETLDPETQRIGDYKEAMNIGEYQNGKPQQPLPASLIPHESDIESFFTLCRKTCTRILTLLALGLEIEPNFLTKAHDPDTGPSGSILRYLYYPSAHASSTATYHHDGSDARAGAHSDYGSITLLFQRVGGEGLEIQLPGGGWAGVPVCPGLESESAGKLVSGRGPGGGRGESERDGTPPVVVNIGDLLSYWTDGLLKSTMHRVVFPDHQEGQQGQQGQDQDQDRYSIVFFSHPVNSTQLTPVPSAIVAAHRKVREDAAAAAGSDAGLDGAGLEPGTITASQHLKARLLATYGFE